MPLLDGGGGRRERECLMCWCDDCVQALKELKAKAAGKGAFGGAGLKKSGGGGKK